MKDSTLIALAVLPYIMIPAALYVSIKTDPARLMLTPEERRVLEYASPAVTKAEAAASETPEASGWRGAGPFVLEKRPGHAPAAAPVISATATGGESAGGGLTLVVFNGKQSLAVIDGEVVRTGEKTGRMTVERIEKDRVLVFDGRLKWLRMERER